jgi:FkbM family methyltransferase
LADKWWTTKFEARRLVQTPQAFSNWAELLSGLAREKLGRGPAELTFKTRSGQSITVPNAPGARVPAYEVFADDCYHLDWFLGDLADRPIRVLDIGGHVGTFSCWLAHVHPGATIDAFEPAPDTVGYLRRNVAANGFQDRITVHEQALAGTTGFAIFDQQGAGSGHNFLARHDEVEGTGHRVATVAFDEAVADVGGPIDLIKMDCEGGEYDLVYNSSPESWASVQRLVLEYHTVEGQSWPELRQWFADRGLHVVRNDMTESIHNLGVAWLSRTPLRDPAGKGPRTAVGKLAYEARRVAQTPRTFDNWPSLLAGLAREKVGHGPDTLTFVTRSGSRITSPNVPGARLPAYEQFAEDGYHLKWFLGDLAKEKIHAVDVGAHVGTFALRLAEEHPTATLTCFEPSEETAGFLQRNIDANGLADRITVEQAALTGESGWALFHDLGGASVHSGLVDGSDAASVGEGTNVKVRTLGWDDVVAAAPAPIVFVKLDCEGGEYQLAYKSSPESWASVQRVVLEYHDVPGESWADLRAWFAGVGLHLVRQLPTRADLGLAWLSRGPVA